MAVEHKTRLIYWPIEALIGGWRFLPQVPPRLLLIFFIITAQVVADGLNWVFGEAGSATSTIGQLALRGAIFGAIFLMAWPPLDDLWQRQRERLVTLVRPVIVVLLLLTVLEGVALWGSLVQASPYSNDAIALNRRAIDYLLKGVNPYGKPSIVSTLEDFRMPSTRTTPLRQGALSEVFPYPSDMELEMVFRLAKARGELDPLEFESKISYPAGSFLFPAPFVLLGLSDLRLFYLLCALIMVAGLIYWTSPGLRGLAALACLINLGLWSQVFGGTIDTLYGMLLFAGWVNRRNPWRSAVLMGFAAASKQIVWFFLPFYLVRVLQESGGRRALKSATILAGAFLLTNASFILVSPRDWFSGVMAPMLDPMFPMGVGIISLFVSGLVPPAPPLFFSLWEGLVLAGALVWYYRNGNRAPSSGLLLGILPLFFAWRSLPSYFFLVPVLVFGAVVAEEYRDFRRATLPKILAWAA